MTNTITCSVAALVPATATTQAHVHQCTRRVAVGEGHLGEHHCGACGASFVAAGMVDAPTATEKCEACAAIQPMANLREMHPEPDVTQYVCVDTDACSARVTGRLASRAGTLPTWPASAGNHAERVSLYEMLATPAGPAPRQDPAQVDPGLAAAADIIASMRAVLDDMPWSAPWRGTLRQQLGRLERELVAYRPPVVEAELTELHVDPGVVGEVADLGRRVTELERAVANLIRGDAPPYVHALLDAYLHGGPLNFAGAPVPADVRRRLEDARPGGCHLIAVRTADGRTHKPADVELVYGP